MMQDWAAWGIETAKLRGATYADARVMDTRQREITTKNNEVGMLLESESLGIGIRVVASGAWGFAATDRLTREGIETCVEQEVSIARYSALSKIKNIQMTPVQAYVDTWQNPYIKDPFRISIESQLELL